MSKLQRARHGRHADDANITVSDCGIAEYRSPCRPWRKSTTLVGIVLAARRQLAPICGSAAFLAWHGLELSDFDHGGKHLGNTIV